jgi:hypothetical protein
MWAGPLVLAAALTGCSGEQGDRYLVVNDTGQVLRVVGCSDCGESGLEVPDGQRAHVRVTATALQFDRPDGSRYGCVAFFNGMPQDEEQELVLSHFDLATFVPAQAAACRNGTFGEG